MAFDDGYARAFLGGCKRGLGSRVSAPYDHDVERSGVGDVAVGDRRGGAEPVFVAHVSGRARRRRRGTAGAGRGGGAFSARRRAADEAGERAGGSCDGRAFEEVPA